MKRDGLSLILADLIPKRILLLIFLFGLGIRLFFVLNSEFPLNDGGMFLTMIYDLQHSHFLLPWFTTYNNASIPYAYPPLAFYMAAFISRIFAVTPVQVLHVMPAVITSLTIPFVYGIASLLFRRSKLALLSAFFFSMLPKSYEWMIMGGGLTRSFGFLFALTAVWMLGKATFLSSRRYTLIAGLAMGLCLLSHMEMAVFCIYSMAIIALYVDRTTRGLMRLTTAYLIGLAVVLPWIVIIVARHGIHPFQNAMSTGFWSYYSLLPLFLFNITSEPFISLIAVFAVLGIIGALITSRYILLIWLLCVYLFNQRSPMNMGTVPLAMLSSLGVYMFQWQPFKTYLSGTTRRRALLSMMSIFGLYGLSMLIAMTFSNYSTLQSLTPAQRRAMDWVQTHTANNASFLVVTPLPASAWYMERTAEWFPALTNRSSPLTMQGAEWLPNNMFNKMYMQRTAWKLCNNEEINCLEKIARKNQVSYTYVYLDLEAEYDNRPSCCSLLTHSLTTSPRYKKIYSKNKITIWKKLL